MAKTTSHVLTDVGANAQQLAELEHQVAEQTDRNLEVEGAFEREADGAATDTEVAKASGDELA